MINICTFNIWKSVHFNYDGCTLHNTGKYKLLHYILLPIVCSLLYIYYMGTLLSNGLLFMSFKWKILIYGLVVCLLMSLIVLINKCCQCYCDSCYKTNPMWWTMLLVLELLIGFPFYTLTIFLFILFSLYY